jgi:ketosteroid isomerase-like protein
MALEQRRLRRGLAMGEARDVMDRLTEAIFRKDFDAVGELYAPDAVAVTPDQGEVKGREAIVGWSKELLDSFPDARYESLDEHEAGGVAIDEGYFVGTNTEPLTGPTGETIPATGKSVRFRACDVATVENGVVTSHRFYFDQMEFLEQLGLAEGAE